uniref:Putative ATPase domain containing protein n=1 Tax=viral metagenome TaxID=1070528 RepID=A0A6H1ZBK6_9ZZZZ
MTKIIGLQIENVKRIGALDLVFDPNHNFVVLGGRNEQGKSSTLDALEMLLRGKKAMPPEPVRRGARKSKIAGELDNGDRIKRIIHDDGRDTLVVTDKEGNKRPRAQTYLDGMLGPIFFDPEEFSRMDEKSQNETLRKLIRLDTAKLDHERDKLYAERTAENREVKRIKALLDSTHKHEVPAQEVSIAALTEEMTRLAEVVAGNATVRAEAQQRATKAEELRATVVEAEKVVHEANERFTQAQADLVATRARADAATKAAAVSACEIDALTDPNLDAVHEKIRTAEATNRLVRENQARAALATALRTVEENSAVLTEDISEIDEEKAALIANAKMPIEGLGFDGNIVTYQGIPFKEQASQSARVRVSAMIGVAMNPDIRVLLIRAGSFCDGDALAALEAVANETDTLMLVEMVTRNAADEEMCTYVIEDGAVRDGS